MSYPIPVVCCVTKLSDGKFLFAQAAKPHDHGKWYWPGGKIEFGESPEHACIREMREEFNIAIQDIQFTGLVFNHYRPEFDSHFIVLPYLCATKDENFILDAPSIMNMHRIRLDEVIRYDCINYIPIDIAKYLLHHAERF